MEMSSLPVILYAIAKFCSNQRVKNPAVVTRQVHLVIKCSQG